MSPRALVAAAVFVAGCAVPGTSSPPLRVDVLDAGFLVDNTVLATTDELRAFVADAKPSTVTLRAPRGTPNDRLERAASAVRDGGAAVEIVVARLP